jgi:integrase/recombinase XerC
MCSVKFIIDGDFSLLCEKCRINKTVFSRNFYSMFLECADVKPRSIVTYRKSLRKLDKFWRSIHVTQPTRFDLIEFKRYVAEKYRATSASTYIYSVKAFFKWLAENGLYADIGYGVKGCYISDDLKRDYLTVNQINVILDKIMKYDLTGLRDYAMVLVMVTTGLRRCEIVKTNVGDLHPCGENMALFIQGKGRTDKTEYVKITPKVEAAIRDYLKERGPAPLAAPLFASTAFCNCGDRLSETIISSRIKLHMRDAGFDSERLTAHSLRHTAITLALQGGASLYDVKQFARHSRIATTLVYCHTMSYAKNPCSTVVTDMIFKNRNK